MPIIGGLFLGRFIRNRAKAARHSLESDIVEREVKRRVFSEQTLFWGLALGVLGLLFFLKGRS